MRRFGRCRGVSFLFLILFLGVLERSAHALTLVPANIDKGMMKFQLGYSNSDNSKATTEDPTIIESLLLTYGLSEAFEVSGLAGIGQIQNLSSGVKINGTPTIYGGSLKYLLTAYIPEKPPVDVALTLGYTYAAVSFDASGTKTDASTATTTYGVVVSKDAPLDVWPYRIIPYGGFNMNSSTASATQSGSTSTGSETLRSLDVGIRFPFSPEFWFLAEYNNMSGYTNTTALKDSTTTTWVVGAAYYFNMLTK